MTTEAAGASPVERTVRAGSEALHAAVCQAVALLNRAPEVARCAEGRDARDLLRQALANYADAYMDEPVTESERAAIARKHQRKRTPPPGVDVQRPYDLSTKPGWSRKP